MFFLITLIHLVFSVIFYFFHRYVEMSVIIGIYLLFLTKVIPTIDVFKRPKFIREKTSEKETMKQSLQLSTGILFYTALVGLALGLANSLGVLVNMRLLYYSVLFLSCVIFGIYLLFYPRVLGVFIIFRTHVLIASSLLTLVTIVSLVFGIISLDSLLFVDLFLLILGLLLVVTFDREVPIGAHIFSVYVFIGTVLSTVAGSISYFGGGIALIVVSLIVTIAFLYLFFPTILRQTFHSHHIPLISWHSTNALVGLSWIGFFYVFYAVFWGESFDAVYYVASVIILFGFWFWVYITDLRNSLFFSGSVAALSTLCGYFIFMVLPSIFWISTLSLFIYGGMLILGSRWFKNTKEELILAGGAVVFLCGADLVMIFQEYGLFALSMLFFFQSFLWYGAYESFFRQSEIAQNIEKAKQSSV